MMKKVLFLAFIALGIISSVYAVFSISPKSLSSEPVVITGISNNSQTLGIKSQKVEITPQVVRKSF